MDKGMFLKRPKPGETEDDLLIMQENWQAQNNKGTVQIHKMKSKSNHEPQTKQTIEVEGKDFVKGGRFEIDLDDESPAQVIYAVEEKNADWLAGDRVAELISYGFDKVEYSKEGGFPLALDLISYYTPDENGQVRTAPAGKSFFAAEFDRLHGQIDEATCSYKDISMDSVETADFSTENDRYISKLADEKIKELQNEIQSRLDPKTIEFIKNRHKAKVDKQDAAPKKISKFKQDKLVANQNGSKTVVEVKNKQEEITEDYIKELEVLGIYEKKAKDEDYQRLAADAIQMDITTKMMKSMVPRQERIALRLFDELKVSTSNNDPLIVDPFVEDARARIEDIKLIYLEEVEKDGRRFPQFATGLNPVLNTCWTLRPIRSVLDAVAKRENHVPTADDVEIVRLCLLWTFLLFTERLSMFYAYVEPKEFYVRLTEVFLLGSEMMEDDISMKCVDKLMDTYVLQNAIDGRLHIRLDEKIAGLDAFAPYFDDLITNYESYSLGNVSFARAILIGAYLNSCLGDGLMCQFSIFSPKKNVARQIVATNADIADILTEIRRSSQENALRLEDQYYQQYVELLGAYAAAIRDDKVTKERNQLMFTIASEELGRFVKRHTAAPPEEKDFDIIVDLVRSTVKDKLDL